MTFTGSKHSAINSTECFVLLRSGHCLTEGLQAGSEGRSEAVSHLASWRLLDWILFTWTVRTERKERKRFQMFPLGRGRSEAVMLWLVGCPWGSCLLHPGMAGWTGNNGVSRLPWMLVLRHDVSWPRWGQMHWQECSPDHSHTFLFQSCHSLSLHAAQVPITQMCLSEKALTRKILPLDTCTGTWQNEDDYLYLPNSPGLVIFRG